MNNWWSRTLILIVALASYAACLGCGSADHPTGDPLVPQPSGLTDPGILGSATLRDTSGTPSGVRLIWTSSVEAGIAGYHIYKSTEPIADTARGNSAMWLEIDGSPEIPQPVPPGADVIIDDIFPVTTGDRVYYRMTSVATDGDESRLSPEIAVTIAPFAVTGLNTHRVSVGDQFTVLGENFGLFNSSTDSVSIVGSVWIPGTGFELATLQCPVIDWQPSEIVVSLPPSATSSLVSVTIDGVTQQTTRLMINSDPFIVHCTHYAANPGDMIALSGMNFGSAVGASNHVVFGPAALTNSEHYYEYSSTVITFECPSLPPGTYDVSVIAGGNQSNVARIDLGIVVGPAWEHTWGGELLDSASAVTADETTGVYLAGYTADFTTDPLDALIVKYDSGIFAWGRVWNNIDYGPTYRDESLNDICYDSSGYVYAVGGAFSSSGSPCMLLLAYDTDGNWQYARSYEGSSTQSVIGNSIACDGTYIYIAGTISDFDTNLLLVKYDLAGNLIAAQEWVLPSYNEAPEDLVIDGNGDLITVGSAQEAFSGSGADWFILKTDANLARLWGAYWGTMAQDICYSVAMGSTNSILVGGSSDQWTMDYLQPVLVEFDSTGLITGENRWPVAGNSAFISLDIAGTGNVYAVGSRWPGVPDAMLLVLDPTNYSTLASWLYRGAPGLPIATGGCLDANDDVVFCGLAPRLGASWIPLAVTTEPITDATNVLTVTTDLTTATGSPVTLTGESLPATGGIEDVGAGAEDVLVVKYNPE